MCSIKGTVSQEIFVDIFLSVVSFRLEKQIAYTLLQSAVKEL